VLGCCMIVNRHEALGEFECHCSRSTFTMQRMLLLYLMAITVCLLSSEILYVVQHKTMPRVDHLT
jgi:hypothetical protein